MRLGMELLSVYDRVNSCVCVCRKLLCAVVKAKVAVEKTSKTNGEDIIGVRGVNVERGKVGL